MQLLSTIALISVQSDPADETGSQNIYVRQLGEALSRLGWHVDMFTRKSDLNQADIVQHNPNCRTIRLTAGAKQFLEQQNLIGYLPEFLAQLLQFQQKNQLKYRLVHTNYWLSAWIGMELKKNQPLKHIHTFHSVGAVKYAHEKDVDNLTKNRLAIEKTCLQTADLTIATCPQQRDYLQKLVSDQGCIKIVPCGTDLNLFGLSRQIKATKQSIVKSDLFNIIYVGRFSRRQGVETLIKAIAKPQLHSLGNIHLTLINNSNIHSPLQRKRIEKLVWDLGVDNITTFVEGLCREELATYYAAADICVVPSHYNPLGMVAMESMASGTPVVAANLGALKYIVEHEQTGLLFPSQNSFLLAKAISRLMTDTELRSKMSSLSKKRIAKLFTWDKVAHQISELYLDQIEQQKLASLRKSLSSPVLAAQL